MPTRNVSLTDHQDLFVGEALASGRYQNASEVVRDALRLLERREADDASQIAHWRAAVAEGERQLAAGDFIDLEIEEFEGWLSSLGPQSPE